MPRKRKIKIDAERYVGKYHVEYYITMPSQFVVISAENMTHSEVSRLLSEIAKHPRALGALDGYKHRGWAFYMHSLPNPPEVPEDPSFEIVGYGPGLKELYIYFQKPNASVRALALAVVLSKEGVGSLA